MSQTKLFPSGIALGSAFCNREKEREYLRQCLENNEHVVLVAPRRYGKTSLIAQVIHETKMVSVSIDLLLAPNASFVVEAILTGVSNACSQLIQEQGSIKDRVFSLFASFNPRLTLSALGQKLEFSSNNQTVSAIAEALLLLETAAQEADIHIIFAMDEFQQVGTLANYHTIEASIRHAVERSKNVTYIFSGSNRHMLEQMFNDKTRPLYHLCELLRLDRIKPHDLHGFIKKLSEKQWGSNLGEESLELIITLTEQHTFYINRLCRLLWKHNQKPDNKVVKAAWDSYVKSQQWIADDLSKLTANQRNIMQALAKQPTTEIYGEYMRNATKIQASSINKTIVSLQKTDMIYCDENNSFKITDPAVRYFILAKLR